MAFDQRSLENSKTRTFLPGTALVVAVVGAVGLTVYFAMVKPLIIDKDKWSAMREQQVHQMIQRQNEERKKQMDKMRKEMIEKRNREALANMASDKVSEGKQPAESK